MVEYIEISVFSASIYATAWSTKFHLKIENSKKREKVIHFSGTFNTGIDPFISFNFVKLTIKNIYEQHNMRG